MCNLLIDVIMSNSFKVSENMDKHKNKIVDQFTKQATPFSKVAGHLSSINRLIGLSAVDKNSTVLDVACGPGLVASEYAKLVSSVTCVDITPKMVNLAKEKMADLKLENTKFSISDFYNLPFQDNTFDCVVTRYSFHHLLDTKKALEEMIRVCKVGGKVVVADVAINPNSSRRYDELEKLRDPSHTHALTTKEFSNLYKDSNLNSIFKDIYYVDIELEDQINASFPEDGSEQKIRNIIKKDVGLNLIGINVRSINNQFWYSVPIEIYSGVKS